MIALTKFIKLRIVIVVALLAIGPCLIVARQPVFYSTGDNNCATWGTDRGAPFGFLKSSYSTSTFGEPCTPNVPEAATYDGFSLIPLLADFAIWFTVLYFPARLILWRIAQDAFRKSEHILFKATVFGVIGLFIARWRTPPEPGVVLGDFHTNIMGYAGFIGGFVLAGAVLLGFSKKHTATEKYRFFAIGFVALIPLTLLVIAG